MNSLKTLLRPSLAKIILTFTLFTLSSYLWRLIDILVWYMVSAFLIMFANMKREK